MRSQSIPLVVLDNGSTDGSYEFLKRHVGQGILLLERIETDKFELAFIIKKLYQLALRFNPDWLVKFDADEFLEPPFGAEDLREAIERQSKTYNLIQFDNFEFWPTEKDEDSNERDFRKRSRYYSWNDDWQFKCWRHYPGTTLHETGGHLPIFPADIEVRLCPIKFVLRHYCIRSLKQGMRKVFEGRLPRYAKKELEQGWHLRFKTFKRDPSYFVMQSERLSRYNDDGKWILDKKLRLSSAHDMLPKQWNSQVVRALMSQYKEAYQNWERELVGRFG